MCALLTEKEGVDITTPEEKRKVTTLKWNHRQPKNNKQVCCTRECTCPFDPTTVILQHTD